MSSDRPFVCDVCTKIFTRNENLERHKRSKHLGDTHRPFECPQCQSRFSRKDVCKRHAERCRGPREPRGDPTVRTQPSSLSPMADDASPSINVEISQQQEPLSSGPMQGLNEGPSPGDDWTQSTLPPLPSAFGELHRNADTYISAYRCLYTARNLTGQEAVSCVEISRSLWESGHDEIHRLANVAWRGLHRPWVVQAWLLHIVYGAYAGDTLRYQKAKQLLRTLVDCVQDLGLLRQSAMYPGSRPWIQACAGGAGNQDEAQLNSYWAMYVDEESMKISMHTLMFLDFHVLYPCNIRSQTSAVELDWELPFSSALWEASTATEWFQILCEDTRVMAHMEPDEVLCLPCPSTRSLPQATQSLMSDAPSIHLLSALEACPITIVFLLTSVDALVRDMTRSLYQLPPNLADPSAFHILSQTQNRQIAAVLKHVSRLVEEQPDPEPYGAERPCWSAVERLCLAIKVSLYKPDDLLIRGVVDSSATAGLSTATHLALGRYTGSRRSLQSLLQHSSGDDLLLALLEESVGALDSILASGWHGSTSEAPWVTVASYRILLAIWRSMRWAAAEMRKRAQTGTQSRFDTPTVIFNTIIGVVSDRTEIGHSQNGVPSPSSMTGETCFSQAVLKFWTDRSVWAMGSSMVPILEEIISAGI